MTSLRQVGCGILVVGFAAGTASCGSGGSETTVEAPAAPVTNPVDPATAAAVTGRVTLMGQVPAAQPITMASDPRCTNTGAVTETVVADAKGGLQNVFVYVKDGLGNLVFPVPTTPVVLDQKGCQYRPHVFGVRSLRFLLSATRRTVTTRHLKWWRRRRWPAGACKGGW